MPRRSATWCGRPTRGTSGASASSPRRCSRIEDYSALIRAGEVRVLAGGGEVLGVLVIRPAEDHLFLGNVAVSPGHQGRGLGRELVAFAEGQAAEHGLPEVRLYTEEKMHENLSVYARLGFEETGRGLEGGYRRVFMRKRLR